MMFGPASLIVSRNCWSICPSSSSVASSPVPPPARREPSTRAISASSARSIALRLRQPFGRAAPFRVEASASRGGRFQRRLHRTLAQRVVARHGLLCAAPTPRASAARPPAPARAAAALPRAAHGAGSADVPRAPSPASPPAATGHPARRKAPARARCCCASASSAGTASLALRNRASRAGRSPRDQRESLALAAWIAKVAQRLLCRGQRLRRGAQAGESASQLRAVVSSASRRAAARSSVARSSGRAARWRSARSLALVRLPGALCLASFVWRDVPGRA